MNNALIFPMAFYVFFMWISTVLMFRTRVHAIKAGDVEPKYFKAHLGEPPGERVVIVGRHYDNQFQLPLLFFVTCVLQIQLAKVNIITLVLAWLFVVSRFLHSWILLGRNALRLRVAVFAFGWLMILFLWDQLVYFA